MAFVFPGALGMAMGEELTESSASRKSRALVGGLLIFVGILIGALPRCLGPGGQPALRA